MCLVLEGPVPRDSVFSQSSCMDAAKAVLHAGKSALEHLESTWDAHMVEDWTRHVVQREGRVVLSGMGKSGLIAQKISATLASTGCPSFFLHPGEALHGDLGMVTGRDTLLLLSNSGETEEILRLIPSLARMGNPMGAITSRGDSRLAQAARWRFLYSLPQGEGCPLNFAPMASTTLQLVWGDLLAAYHMVATGFTLEAFANFHPGGSLGAKLLKTAELMHIDFPKVTLEDSLVHCLNAMTKGKLGMTTVTDQDRLVGVISDGDIRRALERAETQTCNPLSLKAKDVMTPKPVVAELDSMALTAAHMMEARKITFLVVTDGDTPKGVLHIHDLMSAKVI